MKTLVIPAGYAITVVSWENDADYYATKTMSGLSKEHARIVVDFAKIFRSCYRFDTNRGTTSFDNLYEPSEGDLEELYTATDAIIGDDPFFKVVYGWDNYERPTKEDMSYMSDAVYELMLSLGLSGQQENQFSRVAESITVHYYAEPIYAEDVTSTFN